MRRKVGRTGALENHGGPARAALANPAYMLIPARRVNGINAWKKCN
jgi:hypothetical protein